MTDENDVAEPKGIGIKITSTNHVVVKFDHGEIPPIKLTISGAEQVGSHIATAANQARNPDGGD